MRQENKLTTPRNALQPDYELLWYKIRTVLGQGAFGITYLAQDVNLNRLVAIKEFMPGQYTMRDGKETVRPVTEELQEKFTWGLRRFIEEARILDQFEHPNIVRVTNIFEANNTAYMVMRYEQGVSLKEILIKQKFLDESDLLNILFPILDGLEQIHEAGFIHRDIKPANIFIRTDGTPVLLDFGSARQSLEKETHTLTSLVSPGYAPIEQYVSKSDKQGPWSDIYGMAATLYRAVTGVPPNDAITRGESLTGNKKDNLINCRELADKRYSDQFIAGIDHGLAFLTRDRPQSVSEWKQELLPLAEKGESSQTVLSGHASGQVVSLVKESLTQTVTRLHHDSKMPDVWDKNDETSVELAHKKGFRRGLKFALVTLTLIVGGLFVGNFQKIQQVVKPGFVTQDIISDKPVERIEDEIVLTQPAIIDEEVIGTGGKIVETEVFTGNSPPVLDEETAAQLMAEGKIIIVDEVSIEDSTSKIIYEDELLDSYKEEEVYYGEIPVQEVSQQQAAGFNHDIILEQNETIIEINNDQSLDREIDIKESSENIIAPVAQVDVDNKKTTTKTSVQQGIVIEEVYVPERKKVVEIEEVHVPVRKSRGENVVEKVKGWVNYLMTNGKPADQGNDQAGGGMLEDK